MKILKLYLFTIFVLATVTSFGQKLPNVQPGSLRAPANIKIDGKSADWGNQLKAYNSTTQINYSIANDDDRLYLILQSADADVIEKIVKGGVTLSINTSGKKKSKDNPAITFPAYDKKNPNFAIILNNRPALTTDQARNQMQADSFINAKNRQLADHLTGIGVAGVKSINDNIISIYNQEGIKAAAIFDARLMFTCELAIPLKYLGLSIGNTTKFNYNITLNGPAINGGVIQVNMGGREFLTFTGGDGVTYNMGPSTPHNMDMAYPTDFWGKYTLVKK